MSLRRWSIAVALLMALAGFLPATAMAGTVPAGWSCTGGCGTDGADGVVTLSPYGSSMYEYVTTTGGIMGVGVLPTGALGGETDGSTLATPWFSANAGDSLNFYFNYVTSDGSGYPDYAWAALINSSNIATILFTARTEPYPGQTVPGPGMPTPVATLNPSNIPIIPGGPVWSPLGGWSGQCWASGCGYTGWIDANYTIPTAGTYDLEIGTVNMWDTLFDSGLAMDGAVVGGKPISTPEPGTLLLLGNGMLSLFFLRRRFAK